MREVFTRWARACMQCPSGRGQVQLGFYSADRPQTQLLSPRRSRPGSSSRPTVLFLRTGHVRLSVSPAARPSPHNPKCPLPELSGVGLFPARERTQPARGKGGKPPEGPGHEGQGPAVPSTHFTRGGSCCVSSSKVLPYWALFLSCKNTPSPQTA